ncbi:MAG: outer membrane beta-barrel protein, partial [Flavobacteriaceae bacterium]|nr:outer membrane beta-barrel protein [Flavobacteriaceae bacterium]
LWQRLSGVAMVLILFLSGSIWYNNSKTNNTSINSVSENRVNQVEIKNQLPVIQIPENTRDNLVQVQKIKKTKLKKELPIFVKNPNNNVIVTSSDISTVYETIKNKYVVNKKDFIDEIKNNNIIVEAENRIKQNNTKIVGNKKWSVGPTVTPVYYNTLQDGSPINDNLSNNSKSADDALSVGVKINYQLTKKIKIQSGLNKVELAYNTKDVSAYISSVKNANTNINTNKSGVILSPISNSQSDLSTINSVNKSSIIGDLNQSIEYLEFPVEIKYNLYDKKLGLNLVGGFSTFVLTNNSVVIVSQNSITSLGEANNLNNINFSGNLGVDLDYKINKNWYLNVAPMFKYQFNTYSNNSGNFKPYYLGVYSGLNYKF